MAAEHPIATGAGDDAAPAVPHAADAPAPFLLLAAVAAVAALVRSAARPLNDIDLYWHLLVGRDILAGIPVGEAGRGWSFAPVPDTWVSTQWGAEVLFAWLYDRFGFTSFVVLRTVSVLVALVVLALTTLRGRPARAAAWPFAVAALALAATSQERSQQLSYALAPLVGWWALRLWRDGRAPRWWVVLPLTVVWANVHGGWVLLPLVLLLASVARVIDARDLRDRAALVGAALAVGTVAAALVSPAGVDTVLAVVRFSSSTSLIAEWAPVRPLDGAAVPLDLMALTLVLCWALGRRRPTLGEVVLLLPIVAFGYTAWRSTTPACLVLAPLVAATLARAIGDGDPLPDGVRNRMAGASLAIAAAGAVLALCLAVVQSPAVNPNVPTELLARLHATTAPQRVLTTYNVAGPVLWFGGPPPHVVVGIDGRADRYGGDYLQRYAEDLVNAAPGWEDLFARLAPTAAVLEEQERLVDVLVQDRGWVEVTREDGYVLLRSPDAPGWS